MSDDEIKVLGVDTSPVEKNQLPLIQTDKGSLYATGNIILLKERDLPKLFSENQIKVNQDSDLIFVPDDVVRTWIGSNSKDERRDEQC